MDSITSKWMNIIDANCEYVGIQKIQLMENAGSSVAQEIEGYFRTAKDTPMQVHNTDDNRCNTKYTDKYNVVMFAGTGNNGGDAFVAARHLAVLNAFSVSVILLGRERDIKTDEAHRNFMALDTDSITVFKITDSSMLASLSEMIKSADCIVDAILGTGIKGKVREPASTAIDMINNSSAFKIAIDVPSGCDGDTGSYDKYNEYAKTVSADTTITFHRMKPGIRDAKCAGTVKVVPIGIPDSAFRYVGLGDLMMLGARNPMSHKGNSGRVLIIGGGAYTGAPALAALGALRSGADIVTVAAPASVSREVQAMSPNMIVRTLSGDRLCDDDIPHLTPLIKEHDCVVIGMGLGKGCDSVVSKVVGMCDRVVIDADAITEEVIASLQDSKCGTSAIITPHVGEFRRLANLSEELESRCIDVSGLCAQGVGTNSSGNGVDYGNEHDNCHDNNYNNDANSNNKNIVALLKGRIDIISDGMMTRLNSTGNAGMTVGGTGDVLAGIAGALFARHDAFDAACLAAFINGRAGDMAYDKYKTGLIATDIIEEIAGAMII